MIEDDYTVIYITPTQAVAIPINEDEYEDEQIGYMIPVGFATS